MIAGLLLLAGAAVAAQPVEQAERAFAAMAQTQGQWKAFAAFAAPDAIMLAPDVVKAADFLPTLKEPKVAVMWWPARTVTSCDGTLALSTGPWRRDGGRRTGKFYTMWQRQADGAWKWIYDGGSDDKAPSAAGERPQAIRAACRRPVGTPPAEGKSAGGVSPDGSLRWALDPAAEPTTYRLRVWYVTAKGWQSAVDTIVG